MMEKPSFPNDSSSATTPSEMMAPPTNKCPFPVKLHQLLENAEANGYDSVVSWLPQGHAFQVHKPQEFTEKIMKDFFRQTKFQSFTRQLYLYGFVKVRFGADRGAFYHPSFKRDDKTSSFAIERTKNVPVVAQHASSKQKTSSTSSSLHKSSSFSLVGDADDTSPPATPGPGVPQGLFDTPEMLLPHPELRTTIEDEESITISNVNRSRNSTTGLLDCHRDLQGAGGAPPPRGLVHEPALSGQHIQHIHHLSSSFDWTPVGTSTAPTNINTSSGSSVPLHAILSASRTTTTNLTDISPFVRLQQQEAKLPDDHHHIHHFGGGSSGGGGASIEPSPIAAASASIVIGETAPASAATTTTTHGNTTTSTSSSSWTVSGTDLSWLDSAMLRDLEPRRIEDMMDGSDGGGSSI